MFSFSSALAFAYKIIKMFTAALVVSLVAGQESIEKHSLRAPFFDGTYMAQLSAHVLSSRRTRCSV